MALRSAFHMPIHKNGSSFFGEMLNGENLSRGRRGRLFEQNRSEEHAHPSQHHLYSKTSVGTFDVEGLHVLKSRAPLPIPTRRGVLLVPQYPLEEALRLLKKFFEKCQRHNPQFENRTVAWINHKKTALQFYPPAFESRGLPLKDLLFLESAHPAKTLHTVCDEGQFNAIVVVQPASRAAAQIAKKWLKPRDGPTLYKADEMERQKNERLIIFIE